MLDIVHAAIKRVTEKRSPAYFPCSALSNFFSISLWPRFLILHPLIQDPVQGLVGLRSLPSPLRRAFLGCHVDRVRDRLPRLPEQPTTILCVRELDGMQREIGPARSGRETGDAPAP